MKIVCVDNFNRDTISDKLIAESVPDLYAKYITECLNEHFGGEDSADFFRVVPDDYKLYIWKL